MEAVLIGLIVALIVVPIIAVLFLLISPIHFGSWGQDDTDIDDFN